MITQESQLSFMLKGENKNINLCLKERRIVIIYAEKKERIGTILHTSFQRALSRVTFCDLARV